MSDADAGIAEVPVSLAGGMIDPRYAADSIEPHRPSPVWEESIRLRDVLAKDGKTDEGACEVLRRALVKQISTLKLYRHVILHRGAIRMRKAASREATLYTIVFPGEGKDNTGIKQLNDKVLGYYYSSQFILARQKAIRDIFNGKEGGETPGFVTVGQDYKAAMILAVGRTRRQFAGELERLDAALTDALKEVLDNAEANSKTPPDKKAEIRKLRNAIQKEQRKNKGRYRFGFLFGAATRIMDDAGVIDTVFLLVTEAAKGAGVARWIEKGEAVAKMWWRREPKAIVRLHKVPRDPESDDVRGKSYDNEQYRRATRAAKAMRKRVTEPPLSARVDFQNIFVNGVWTVSFLVYLPDERRFVANPDVVRDVRKRLLAKPPKRRGLKTGLEDQKVLWELWLVALNVNDLLKEFRVSEFRNQLVDFHNGGSAAYEELQRAGQPVQWPRLRQLLTRDLRQGSEPFSVQGTGSEFAFYAPVSDQADWIFFVMDVRDLGVELMLPYELANDEIQMRRLADGKLLLETLWASDPIVRRKRATYEAVVEVFRDFHGRRRPGTTAVQRAFGPGVDPMPAVATDAFHVMMGGDEFFVAAHPAFAAWESEIIATLDGRKYKELPLNLRTGIVYSSAYWKRASKMPTPEQRDSNIEAHDKALRLASDIPGDLKPLERTHRRLERLIEKLEGNPKKKLDAPKFRQELDALRLMKLYARLKREGGKPMDAAEYQKLLRAFALATENKGTAVTELVEFTGTVVDQKALDAKTKDLERRLENRVGYGPGSDNFHADPPPLVDIPWWVQKVINDWLDKDPDKPAKARVQAPPITI